MTHPKMANKVVLVDFDGTIVPWGPLMAWKDPFPGVREAMLDLQGLGYTIGIFTSRMSPAWIKKEKTTEGIQRNYIMAILINNGIPFHFITAEKVPAEAYFDDMAIHVPEGKLAITISNWTLEHADTPTAA